MNFAWRFAILNLSVGVYSRTYTFAFQPLVPISSTRCVWLDASLIWNLISLGHRTLPRAIFMRIRRFIIRTIGLRKYESFAGNHFDFGPLCLISAIYAFTILIVGVLIHYILSVSKFSWNWTCCHLVLYLFNFISRLLRQRCLLDGSLWGVRQLRPSLIALGSHLQIATLAPINQVWVRFLDLHTLLGSIWSLFTRLLSAFLFV